MEEDSPSPFAPDFLAPSQWRDVHARDDDPIQRLMRAVLEDALRDALEIKRPSGRARCKAENDALRSRRARERAAEARA